MERLTIDEIIAHCKRQTDGLERRMSAEQYETADMRNFFVQEYWEHRQVAEYLEELKEYRKAEEQGLLKMLPCRVGDTVYVATRTLNKRRGFYGEKTMIFEDEHIPEYVQCKVVGISFKSKGNFIKVRYTGKFEEKYFDDETGYDYRIITDSVDKNYVFSSIGETVFLTAEAALAEKGGAE